MVFVLSGVWVLLFAPFDALRLLASSMEAQAYQTA
jgi:hypothetical protein